MMLRLGRCRISYIVIGLFALAGLTGCAHRPPVAEASQVRALQSALSSLGPTVREDEAAEVAELAYDYPRILAHQYKVVRPAPLHNFLVNTGFKKRGLCYEWAEDLLVQLQALHLESLKLHWGIARANTYREHNCIVVGAHGQPFAKGIVLDGWRRGGRMVWSQVEEDLYPWIEGELAPTP